jgi:hypothetical protein
MVPTQGHEHLAYENMPLPREDVAEIMILVDEYENYSKNIAFRKLKHAQTATRQSFEARLEEKGDEAADVAPMISRYEDLWRQIVEQLQRVSVSDRMLAKIEKALNTMPTMIKKFYHVLVMNDTMLANMEKWVRDERYKKPLQILRDVQEVAQQIMIEVWPERAFKEAAVQRCEEEVAVFSIDDILSWSNRSR